MSRTSARQLKARQHEEQALELRLGGATYAQIGEALGMSASGAFKAVDRALLRHAAETDEKAEKLRRIEVARLDRLLLGVWPRAKRGDEHAARVALQISKRRSELLGIDRKPRPEPDDERSSRRLAARRELSSREIASAMDETLARYRAGRIDADQAHQELALLQGMLKAIEQTTLEEKLERIEAALDAEGPEDGAQGATSRVCWPRASRAKRPAAWPYSTSSRWSAAGPAFSQTRTSRP